MSVGEFMGVLAFIALAVGWTILFVVRSLPSNVEKRRQALREKATKQRLLREKDGKQRPRKSKSPPNIVDKVLGLIEIGFGTLILMVIIGVWIQSPRFQPPMLYFSLLLGSVGVGFIAWGTKKFGHTKKSRARSMVERTKGTGDVQWSEFMGTASQPTDTPVIGPPSGQQVTRQAQDGNQPSNFLMRCDGCDSNIKVPSGKSGNRIKCPRCGHEFVASANA